MVSSYVQLLEHRYGDELGEDATEFIGYATEGVQRMRSLINDLLAFSQVGALDRDYEQVNLEAVAEDVVATLSEAIEEDGVEVHVGELPIVVADPSQMKQLLQNLVSNAAKFRQGNDPRIWIESERDGSDWVISVRDNGIGIDEEYQEKVFVIFQRLHDRAEYPGTGIGLAICRKIVEGHGGRIWVQSPPDRAGVEQGSEFRFTIPVLRTGSTPPDEAESVGEEVDRSAETGGVGSPFRAE